jgi:hypothetical protein
MMPDANAHRVAPATSLEAERNTCAINAVCESLLKRNRVILKVSGHRWTAWWARELFHNLTISITCSVKLL